MGIKIKIFIVDDDMAIHDLITAVLPSDDFEIINFYDGEDIIERIENEQPNLIILDIMMPLADGRDICRDIRKNPKMNKVKILMLSAKCEAHERITGLNLGADEYIVKPFNPELLRKKIKSMCGIKNNPCVHP
jgi:DNA-binding response OmpR family regulator